MKTLPSAILMIACLCTTGVAGAEGTPMHEATAGEKAASWDAHLAAEKAYEAKDLVAALAGFGKAYDIVANPESHLMMARILSRMRRHVDAYHAAQGTIREATELSRHSPELAAEQAKTLESATALLGELEELVGFVSVVLATDAPLPGGAKITVGNQAVLNISLPVVVEPGPVVVRLKTPYGDSQAEIEVAAGESVQAELRVPTQPDPEPAQEPLGELPVARDYLIPPALTYASIGVGVTGFVLFGIFGGLSVDAFSDLEDACPQNRCAADEQDQIDRGQRYQTVANVSVVVGSVGAAAAVALLLWDQLGTRTAIVRPTRHGMAVGVQF